jgi:hypothetical protein
MSRSLKINGILWFEQGIVYQRIKKASDPVQHMVPKPKNQRLPISRR